MRIDEAARTLSAHNATSAKAALLGSSALGGMTEEFAKQLGTAVFPQVAQLQELLASQLDSLGFAETIKQMERETVASFAQAVQDAVVGPFADFQRDQVRAAAAMVAEAVAPMGDWRMPSPRIVQSERAKPFTQPPFATIENCVAVDAKHSDAELVYAFMLVWVALYCILLSARSIGPGMRVHVEIVTRAFELAGVLTAVMRSRDTRSPR